MPPDTAPNGDQDRVTDTAATHDPWHGRNPWGCCQDRNTHGGPGCKWPGTETEPLTAPATALTLQELATLAARVVAHMPYATMRGRDSEQAYYDAKALRDALDLIDPQIVRRNHLAPGQPRPHWPDDKGCPP